MWTNNLQRQVVSRFARKKCTSTTTGITCQISSCRMLSSSASSLPKNYDVKIVEVGPRDGLQNEKENVSTKDKIKLIQMLADAGCPYIETGAFVSKKWVPQMTDSMQVMEGLQEWKKSWSPPPHLQEGYHDKNSDDDDDDDLNVVFSCLTPNIKGLELAIQANADEIAIFGSASEEFSQRNINCSIDESLKRFAEVAQKAKELDIPMRGYVSCVMGCPYQGKVKPSKVARVTEKLLELGCHEVSLGDTIGIGTPGDTIEMLQAVEEVAPTDNLAVHFHDTYGMALPNILTAIGRGITAIDSSVAGLGGCPYAKGASGNVATEEVVYMLNGLGISTGIDLYKLIDAGEFICKVIGRDTQSKVAKASLATRKAETICL